MSISPAANSFLICLLTSQLHIVAILLPHQPSGSLAFAITRLAGDCRSAPCLCLFRSRSSCAIADTVRVQSVREFKARTEAAHVRFARTVQCSAVQCERARACPCAATLVAYSLPLSRSMRAGRGASVPRRSQTETKGIDRSARIWIFHCSPSFQASSSVRLHHLSHCCTCTYVYACMEQQLAMQCPLRQPSVVSFASLHSIWP